MKKHLARTLVVAALAFLPAIALAKGGTPQNHHCMKDGAELAGKTKKECKKDGGTWDKIEGDAAKADPAAKAAAPNKGELAPKGDSK